MYLCGGRLRSGEQSVVGPLAIRCLGEFRVQKAFFSCRAMSEDGILWDYSEDEAALRRAVLEQAGTVCFLCDSAKIGTPSLHRVCACQQLDYFLTELPPAPQIAQLLGDRGVEILVAEEASKP